MTVAYVVSRFPHLPETFVVREMDAVERQGVEILLCPLMRQHDPLVHPRSQRWMARAFYTPWLSAGVLRAVGRSFVRRPWRSLQAVAGPLAWMARSPNFLVRTIALLPKCFLLAEEIELRGIEHVHAHFATHATTAAWVVHRLSGVGFSFTAHAHDIYVRQSMLRQKAEAARFIVTCSQFNRRLLAGFTDARKIHVVHYGIELDRYPFRESPPDGPFTIACIASLQPYKGLDNLVRACARLREMTGEFRCAIAGAGELRSDLERLIGECGLEGCVRLLGPRTEEEVAGLLQAAHCFALPSVVTPAGKMEGMPNVLIEALAVGLPVVATRISGIPELVEDGVTGRLVAPGDFVALAAAIAEVIDAPDRAREWGRNGRARVEEGFRLERSAGQLVRLFGDTRTGTGGAK